MLIIDNLHGIRAFLKAVEAGNFSEAGKLLGMSPSAVSRQISHLEDQLSVQLFNRTTRKISLTEAGRVYYERMHRIVGEMDEANQIVANDDHRPVGTLAINVPIGFGEMHIIPVVNNFLKKYPDMAINLTMSDNVVDVIAEGLDLVVRVGALRDSSLIARKLAPNRRILCASPKYVETNGAPTSLDQLKEHSCLVYPYMGRGDEWHFAERLGEGKYGAEQVIPVSGRLRANNTRALYEACKSGLGLAVQPTWMVGDDVKAGRLIDLFPSLECSPTDIETAIYALYPPTRHLSTKVRIFLDFLRDQIGRVPYWERDNNFMYF